MPTIYELFGILIILHTRGEHPPPHIHAKYQGYEACVTIETGEVIVGALPPRTLKLVRRWLAKNKQAVLQEWAKMERGERVQKILQPQEF
jgi:hypothetical protein